MTIPEEAHLPLLAAAREWYDAGFCVIPSHEDGGKRPFGRWKDYQAQRPDWLDVEAWLSSGRYTGIGVLTGSASGNAEMAEIEGPMDLAVERLGRVVAAARQYDQAAGDGYFCDLLTRIASGCVEQSAGGGLHLFMRVTDGPAKGNTKLANVGQGTSRKVVSETRGEGGFVIVAPTPGRNGHPEGASYLFINGGHPSRTVEVTTEDRDVLHELLRLALDEPEPEEAVEPPQRTPSTPYAGLSAFDDYRARVTWRDILEPAGWTWSHRDGERDYWVRPGKAKADGHSASTIEDGPLVNFSTSVDWPVEKGLSKGQVYALLHHEGDLSTAARTLTDSGYGTPGAGGDIPAWEAELDPDATEEDRQEAAASWVAEHLPRIDWHALWADEREEEWIVEPLLATRRLVALYSAPKVGKSLLMLEIAAAIANQRQVLGVTPDRPYRTLYIDFENDPRGDIRERLRDMGYGPDDLDNLVVLSFPNLAKLDTKDGAAQLMAAISHYRTEVVVIDTVSRAVAGEENENDTWLAFYRNTGLALKRAGIALIRLDHSGKDETKGQRGGSAKSGDVDAVWRLSKSGENTFDLVCEASRFQIAEKALTMTRHDEPVLFHKVNGDGLRAKRADLVAAMDAKGMPRDHKLTLNQAKKKARELKISFGNGIFTEQFWRSYCGVPAWQEEAS